MLRLIVRALRHAPALLFVASPLRAQNPRPNVGVVTSPASQRYATAVRLGAAGDLRAARGELTAVLRADPSHTSAKLRLAVLDDVEAGRLPAAAAVRLFRAVHHAAQGSYKEAIAEADASIELSPRYDEAYRLRGRSRADLGDYERAVADYTRAIELNPRNVQARLNRANVHTRRGDLPMGLADYDTAITLAPSDAEAYTSRAVAYATGNQPSRALADLDRAIELDPGLAPAYANKALLYQQLGRTADAVQTLRALVRHARPGYAEIIEHAKRRISELGGP